MANNFNASRSSQLGLGLDLSRDSMSDGHGFYTGQNLLRGRSRSLMSSQLLASSPTTEAHQAQLTHQRDHRLPSLALGMGPSLGQLGLGQGARRTYSTPYSIPNRVQVHSIVEFAPAQSRPPLSPQAHEVTVTEVIRTTKFLTPTSNLDRLSAPNHAVFQARQDCIGLDNNIRFGNEIQEQPNWANLPNPMSNQVNPIMNMNRGYNANRDISHMQVLNTQPAAAGSVLTPHDNQIAGQNQNLNNGDKDDGETVGDGRTHSLPHPKYGPYTCPKCRNVFQTSQTFAAHMLSHHYKYESMDERNKRLAAKYRRKNLRLAYPLLPQRISLKMLARQKNSTVKAKIDDHEKGKGKEVQGEGEEGSTSSGLDNNNFITIDGQIKQEAM